MDVGTTKRFKTLTGSLNKFTLEKHEIAKMLLQLPPTWDAECSTAAGVSHDVRWTCLWILSKVQVRRCLCTRTPANNIHLPPVCDGCTCAQSCKKRRRSMGCRSTTTTSSGRSKDTPASSTGTSPPWPCVPE